MRLIEKLLLDLHPQYLVLQKHVLRGIVNHSYGESQLDSDWNKSQMDNSERNIEDNRLSDTNRYEVLEKYDEVENEEIGTKSTT